MWFTVLFGNDGTYRAEDTANEEEDDEEGDAEVVVEQEEDEEDVAAVAQSDEETCSAADGWVIDFDVEKKVVIRGP